MRQRLIDFLNTYFGVGYFDKVIPDIWITMIIGVLAMSLLFIIRCKNNLLSTKHAIGIIISASFTGLLGGHLFFILQNLRYVFLHPALIGDITGDSVSFGVYAGVIAGIFLYKSFFSIQILKYLDIVASVLGLGIMIGRLGCFLHGCDFGKRSDLAFAVRFPRNSYPFVYQVQKGWINMTDALSLPVHPVQLYGSAKGFILFVAFSILLRKNYFQPGVLFLLFWVSFSIFRFILEIFRDDERGIFFGISTGQYCCVLILFVSVYYLVTLNLLQRKINPSTCLNQISQD